MASNLKLSPLPPVLKPIAHLLKTAIEHETRDPVVTYWARLAAVQAGLKLDKKSKEALAVLLPLMEWLEKEKKVLAENESVTSEIAGSAYIENYALKLFEWADKEDRASRFGKNVVKAFYTASNLFDLMQVFGDLTPEIAHARKYSKWKAAYIHNCLKRGEVPVPGPMGGEEDLEGDGAGLGDVKEDKESERMPPASNVAAAGGCWSTPNPQIEPTNTTPQVQPPPPPSVPVVAPSSASITPQDVSKVQRLCKFASSALDYDDANTAISNLTEALEILNKSQK